MHDPIGSSSKTRRTAAPSRTTDTRRSLTRRRMGGADMEDSFWLLWTEWTTRVSHVSAYGHNRRTARCCLTGARLRGQSHRFFDQGLDDLRLGHGLDHLTADEDLSLAVARRHAEIGFPGLPWTVDDTAHYGHPQRHIEAVEP